MIGELGFKLRKARLALRGLPLSAITGGKNAKMFKSVAFGIKDSLFMHTKSVFDLPGRKRDPAFPASRSSLFCEGFLPILEHFSMERAGTIDLKSFNQTRTASCMPKRDIALFCWLR